MNRLPMKPSAVMEASGAETNVVYIPTLLQPLTGGRSSVEVDGRNRSRGDRQSGRRWPGMRERLIDEGRLRSNISVAVDGEVEPARPAGAGRRASEVHFVAAISGGSGC